MSPEDKKKLKDSIRREVMKERAANKDKSASERINAALNRMNEVDKSEKRPLKPTLKKKPKQIRAEGGGKTARMMRQVDK